MAPDYQIKSVTTFTLTITKQYEKLYKCVFF